MTFEQTCVRFAANKPPFAMLCIGSRCCGDLQEESEYLSANLDPTNNLYHYDYCWFVSRGLIHNRWIDP